MKHRILAAAALTVAAVGVIATPAQAADPFVPSPCGNAVSSDFGQFEGKVIGGANSSYAQDVGFNGQVNPGKKGSANLGFPDPVGKVICNPVFVY
jgi:hypothetical protein